MKCLTHCKRRHPWNAANTYWHTRANGQRYRQCRKCHAEANHRKYVPVCRPIPPKRLLYSAGSYPL